MTESASSSAIGELHKLFDLTGRTALITGGSRGLGLQIAEALGEFGARIVITARKARELDEAVAHLSSLGINATALVCDLSQAEDIKNSVDRLESTIGSVEILVNNAGITWGAPTVDHPLDSWRKVVDVNLTGAFLLTQAVGKRWMIPKRRGRIVNVASVSGLVGNDPAMQATLAYNTTKGGLISFTRALAAEWGRYGITVNALAPGYFWSKMTQGTLNEHEALLVKKTPLGKLGGPSDLKGAALLLASDASSHITGQVICVDGGVSVI